METKRRKEKVKPGRVRTVLTVIAVVLAALALLVIRLQKRVKENYALRRDNAVSSAQVTVGSISTSVSGSGILSDDDVEEISVPAGVELKSIHVNRGDTVEEGELLASVNLNTALTAMNTLNKEIEELDKDIAEAAGETVSSAVSSTVKGRVKTVYASKGDSVISVMGETGALCVISMDGTLSFELSTAALTPGESISVETDGKSYTGTVTAAEDGKATVSITDNGPLVGSVAVARSSEGETLGSGELFITSPLRIMGYAGTVSAVSAAENRAVYPGAPLFTLTDTAYTANYESLLRQRQDKESQLQELITIYRSGGIHAPFSGTVKSVDAVEGTPEENVDGSLPAQSFSVSPDATMTLSLSVDESEILSVNLGQSAVVTLDSDESEEFSGSVKSIDRVGVSTGGVTVYTADIEIEKQEGMLAGMSASATITIEGVDGVMLIPVDALQKTRSGYFVYTSLGEDGSMGGMKEVTVGISNANFVEITSGLESGDTVYYKEKAVDFFTMMAMRGGGYSGSSGARPSGGAAPAGRPAMG